MSVHLKEWEQRYIEEQREIENNKLAQPPPWLLNNTSFCHDGKLPTKHKEKYKNTKEAYTDRLQRIGKKVAIFANFIRK